MPFNSSDAYHRYECSVLQKMRYMHEESVRDFLREVQETSVNRLQVVPFGKVLWRAQKGHSYRQGGQGDPDLIEVECALEPERMKPLPEKVTDGRLNPRGIAYLYLATDQDTACAEVRPWLKSRISLGQFKTRRDLRIVDCTSDQKKWPFKAFDAKNISFIPWEPHEYESVVWGDIGYAMSKPVTVEDSSLSYIPTQIIAESLRHHQADGIAYRSLLTEDGVNIALFDIRDADLVACGLMETRAIRFTFKAWDIHIASSKAMSPLKKNRELPKRPSVRELMRGKLSP
jgi:hypothetical protein